VRSAAAVQAAVIDELRLCSGGKPPTMRELRLAIGDCSAAAIAAAVQTLRYQGKVAWDALDLSESMKSAGDEGKSTPRPAEGPEPTAGTMPRRQRSGPDDEDDEDYPGGVNDARPVPASGGFVPPALARKAGVHAAQTRSAARPLPVPKHESEVARKVREEVEDLRTRRRAALSTATVSRPLELKKSGVADLSFAEELASLLVESPHDLMVAISRKHPGLWRRVILLGRRRDERPAQALYAALERGLNELEAGEPPECEGEVAHAA
jgi:hypothetical protein